MRVFRRDSRSVREAVWLATSLAAIVVATAGCARRGDAPSDALVVHGTIETDDARLSFQVPGRLIERTVDEGQRIEPGMLLARLDDTALDQELAVRRAEVAVAQAALAALDEDVLE